MKKSETPNHRSSIAGACFYHGVDAAAMCTWRNRMGNNFCFQIVRVFSFVRSWKMTWSMCYRRIAVHSCTVAHVLAAIRTCAWCENRNAVHAETERQSHMVNDATERKYESQFSIIRITCVWSFVSSSTWRFVQTLSSACSLIHGSLTLFHFDIICSSVGRCQQRQRSRWQSTYKSINNTCTIRERYATIASVQKRHPMKWITRAKRISEICTREYNFAVNSNFASWRCQCMPTANNCQSSRFACVARLLSSVSQLKSYRYKFAMTNPINILECDEETQF